MFRKNIKFNRRNIWLRDKGRCLYCGNKVSQSNFTFDHVIPRSKGGLTHWDNIVVSCHPCNQKKDSRTPEQAGMKLLVKPARPKVLAGTYTPIFHWEDTMPSSWKDYLGSVQYWTSTLDE
jgi:5-methylcytosine-specific restriction endonuclease McrA